MESAGFVRCSMCALALVAFATRCAALPPPLSISWEITDTCPTVRYGCFIEEVDSRKQTFSAEISLAAWSCNRAVWTINLRGALGVLADGVCLSGDPYQSFECFYQSCGQVECNETRAADFAVAVIVDPTVPNPIVMVVGGWELRPQDPSDSRQPQEYDLAWPCGMLGINFLGITGYGDVSGGPYWANASLSDIMNSGSFSFQCAYCTPMCETGGTVTMSFAIANLFDPRRDFNCDGSSDPDDLSDYVACYFATPPCVRVDFDQDNDVDPDDLADFIVAYYSCA